MKRQEDVLQPRDPVLKELTLGLLLCSRLVNHEAIEIFYRSNIFHFDGNLFWNPLNQFLQSIGDKNLGYLRSLTASINEPAFVERRWNNPDPTIQAVLDHLGPRPEYDEDEDPAMIEASFRTPGRNRPSIIFKLDLQAGPPGILTQEAGRGLGLYKGCKQEFIEHVERCGGEFSDMVELLWRFSVSLERSAGISADDWWVWDGTYCKTERHEFRAKIFPKRPQVVVFSSILLVSQGVIACNWVGCIRCSCDV
jgi:hypothetical protein